MDDLAQRIQTLIENRNGDLWFPEVTADLAARAWGLLRLDPGLTPDSYCTERVLSRNVSAPGEVIARCTATCHTAPAISIEVLTERCATTYRQLGVSFYLRDEILHTTVLPCIEEALAVINQVPSLMSTVCALARSLHVIKPPDEDHDVSFSEPHVPFSIFVSVPEKRVANDALRVAEAIIHEAMHLQLSMIEKVSPLVLSRSKKYYSPWRREYRNAEGILHALYVFGVIERFLERLVLTNKYLAGAQDFKRNRCNEIRRQFENSPYLQFCSDLSRVGSSLVRKLTQA